MPRPAELADAAQLRVLETHGPSVFDRDELRSTFDDVIMALMDAEDVLYPEAEREITVPLLAEVLGKQLGNPGTARGDPRTFANDLFGDLDEFFLTLHKSRRSRAGGSLERHFGFLLQRLGLPFEETRVTDGESDFLLPNAKLYLSSPSDVVLVTAKPTLREHWRKMAVKAARTPHYFLATTDERMSNRAIREVAQNRTMMLVPQPIIERVAAYREEPNVMSFVDFLHAHANPTRQRWAAWGTRARIA